MRVIVIVHAQRTAKIADHKMAEKPWTWKAPEFSENAKRNMSRQDACDKVSGQAVYTRDLSRPGMLYAKILTSPFAHARIVSMDTSDAETLIGV
jgi:xanthine dehydrogenase molybdopterin-binding subunit B